MRAGHFRAVVGNPLPLDHQVFAKQNVPRAAGVVVKLCNAFRTPQPPRDSKTRVRVALRSKRNSVGSVGVDVIFPDVPILSAAKFRKHDAVPPCTTRNRRRRRVLFKAHQRSQSDFSRRGFFRFASFDSFRAAHYSNGFNFENARTLIKALVTHDKPNQLRRREKRGVRDVHCHVQGFRHRNAGGEARHSEPHRRRRRRGGLVRHQYGKVQVPDTRRG